MSRSDSRWSFGLAFTLAAALSGCANFSSVTKYASETKQLSAAFSPMLAGSYQSCVDKITRRALITSTDFDPAKVAKKAAAICGPINEENKAIASLNDLLSEYADTLAALADKELPSYSDEFGSLKGSLAKLKRADDGSALIDEKKLGAVASLIDYLATIATRRIATREVKSLLDQEEAVFAIVDTLKAYADHNYRAWLRDEVRELGVLRVAVDMAKTREPLAANSSQAALLGETRQVEARDKAIDQFLKSADALKASHTKLRQNLKHLDNAELAAQLRLYAAEVSKLRKQLREAY